MNRVGGFLGVERSLTGKRWLIRPVHEPTAFALAQRLGVPELVGRVLAARGVGPEAAEDFFNPRLRGLLPDPAHFKDMARGAERLARAIVDGERVAVFGDYDVDGATAAALLSRFFAAVGRAVRLYIPDRLTEGYGPNTEALLKLRSEGTAVVVTVDCGIGAHEPLAAAAAAGLDVIVVDHHQAGPELPAAVAVINPNRLDEESRHGHLAAVGVAFLLAVQVNRILREAGWYKHRPEPDLRRWLDLVALGTVCDMVPLKDVNRAFVAQGLKVMAGRGNPGVRALFELTGLAEAPGTYHLGFVLGPRINAGGRVGEAGLGARLLATDDAGEAAQIAARLDRFNRERQQIELKVLDAALASVGDLGDRANAPFVLAEGEGWHPGVVGIVASRLAERFNRPALVVTLDGSLGTGSGRSVAGVDLGSAVNAARRAGLLVKGGGHAMAAGFTVERQKLSDLKQFFAERLAPGEDPTDTVARLYLDGALTIAGASTLLSSALSKVGPFGMGNPEPRFVVTRARVANAGVVGTDHLRCVLVGEGGARLDAVAFRCLGSPLADALRDRLGMPFHVAGRLQENVWRGRTGRQLLIDDAAPVPL